MQLYIKWNPNPVAMDFTWFDISWYGLSWSLAILLSYFLSRAIFIQENKPLKHQIDLIQYVFIGALLGARVWDVLYYHWQEFIERPLLIFEIWNGGLSSYGAIIGSTLSLALFTYFYKDFEFTWCLDRIAIVMPLLGGVVRLGNFVNSELYGIPSNLPWAVIFSTIQEHPTPRHPTQVYEAFWLFTCFILFWKMYRLKYYKRGLYTGLFLSLVLGGRVIIELTKDSENVISIFSKTQLLGLTTFFIGIIILVISYLKPKKSMMDTKL